MRRDFGLPPRLRRARTDSAGPALALAAAFCAAAATDAAAQSSPHGFEFQVNSYTTNSQSVPSVAADAQGSFVVAWTSYGSDGGDTSLSSIQAQRFDANGAPLGGQLQVNSYTTSVQRNPSVATDPQGSFVVAWESSGSNDGDTSFFSIQAQRFAANGAPLGGQFQVNSYTTSDQYYPLVATGGQGEFVVVWESYGSAGGDTSAWSIQARRYAANGTPLGDQFQVNSYTTSHQFSPSVAADADGRFVVVWQSYGSAGGDTSSASIQARRFDMDGVPLDGEFQVNEYTTSVQRIPTIATDAVEGSFVVAWESLGSNDGDTSGSSVQARRYDANGAPLGGQFQVNDFTTSVQFSPSVAVDTQGSFVVAWTSYGSSGGDTFGFSVQGRHYDADGGPLGGELQVNSYTTGAQEMPSVAVDAQGNFVVAWSSDGSTGGDTSSRSIQAQRYDALFRDGFETGDDGRWSAAIP